MAHLDKYAILIKHSVKKLELSLPEIKPDELK